MNTKHMRLWAAAVTASVLTVSLSACGGSDDSGGGGGDKAVTTIKV